MFRHTLLFFLFLFVSSAQAAQYAIIKNNKAVVYAEKELLTPLGYVGVGKLIKVGEVLRNHGRALPVVVSGRIGWIKVEDLYIQDELADLRLKKFNYQQDFVEKLEYETFQLEKPSIMVDYGRFYAGEDWRDIAAVINNPDSRVHRTFGTVVDARYGSPAKKNGKSTYRLGGNLIYIYENNVKLQAAGPAVDFTTVLYERPNLYCEWVGSFIYYPWGKFTILNDTIDGMIGGARTSLEVTGHMSPYWSIRGTVGYGLWKLFNFNIEGGQSIERGSVNGIIHGWEMKIGLLLRI